MNEHLFHFYATSNINEGILPVHARVKNILHGEQNIGDNHIFKLKETNRLFRFNIFLRLTANNTKKPFYMKNIDNVFINVF